VCTGFKTSLTIVYRVCLLGHPSKQLAKIYIHTRGFESRTHINKREILHVDMGFERLSVKIIFHRILTQVNNISLFYMCVSDSNPWVPSRKLAKFYIHAHGFDSRTHT
jgi:hypothetical protein